MKKISYTWLLQILIWFIFVNRENYIYIINCLFSGAVIIFTALLSVAFLGSTIKAQMWVGMIGVILGLAVVGLTDIILNDNSKSDINAIIAGKLLMDCCLTPALAIFQLDRGVNFFCISLDTYKTIRNKTRLSIKKTRLCTNKRNIKMIKPYIYNVCYSTIFFNINWISFKNFKIVSPATFV